MLRNEDTLFAKRSDTATAVSRETVSRQSALRPLLAAYCLARTCSLQRDCRGVKQVAAVVVEALFQPGASGWVMEIVASPDAPATPPSQWFKA